jgi:hypothetical protein
MAKAHDDLRSDIDTFETKLGQAFADKYCGVAAAIRDSLVETSPVTRIDITRFFELYDKQETYPPDRLRGLVYQLMDIKIQLFYIVELDIGLYNRLIYDAGFTPETINNSPYMVLRMLSLDQNMIMKSRILWERIMNLVYFLETGNSLEVKRTGKKPRFFKFIENTRWAFLAEYRDYIDWFDDKLRTPEVHKSSVLRKHFQTDTHISSNRILALSNIVINFFYPSLLQILQGREVGTRWWVAGMGMPPPGPAG